MALSFYDAYVDNLAKSPKEEYLSEMSSLVKSDFANSTSVDTVLEETSRGSGLYEEVDVRLTRVIDPKTGGKQGDDWRKITYGELVDDKMGLLYQFFDSYWLVVNGDLSGMPTSSVIATKCNEELKWYDEYGVYREIPIPLISSDARMLLAGNKYMELASGQRDSFVQLNDYTKFLQDGQEFIFGRPEMRTKYRIVHQDDSESCELIGLRLERYQVNPEVDNLELGIANYVDRPRFSLTVLNSDSELAVSNSLQIKYSILDKDSQQVNQDVVFTSSDEDVLTVDSNGLVTAVAEGIATIDVSMAKNKDVSDELILYVVAVPSSNEYLKVDNSTLEITKTFEEIYTWDKYDNGVLLASSFTFTIDGSTTASGSDYKFTVVDGNSYKIECINEGKKVTVNIAEVGGLTKQVTYDLVGFW